MYAPKYGRRLEAGGFNFSENDIGSDGALLRLDEFVQRTHVSVRQLFFQLVTNPTDTTSFMSFPYNEGDSEMPLEFQIRVG